jgi:hypothetical protein
MAAVVAMAVVAVAVAAAVEVAAAAVAAEWEDIQMLDTQNRSRASRSWFATYVDFIV